MIRFIIKRHERDNNSGSEMIDYKTVDVDVPELEKILSGGGSGPMGFESFQLIGTEIITRPVLDVPTMGFTGCVICGSFTDHGGLQCPKLRVTSNGSN